MWKIYNRYYKDWFSLSVPPPQQDALTMVILLMIIMHSGRLKASDEPGRWGGLSKEYMPLEHLIF